MHTRLFFWIRVIRILYTTPIMSQHTLRNYAFRIADHINHLL